MHDFNFHLAGVLLFLLRRPPHALALAARLLLLAVRRVVLRQRRALRPPPPPPRGPLCAAPCARGTQGDARAASCRVGLAARCVLVPCRRQGTRSQKRWARHGPTGIAFRSRFVILHRNMKSTKKSEYGTCRFFMFCSVCIRDFNI